MNDFCDAYAAIVAARGAHRAIEEQAGAGLTHEALWACAGTLAEALRALGIGREDVVALAMERSAALVVGMLGAWRAGAAWTVIDPGLPPARRSRLASLSGARVEVVAAGVGCAPRPGSARGATKEGVADGDRDEALAYVAFTSGSSGEPKAVQVEHRGLMPMLQAQLASFGLDAATRALWVLSPAFDASVSDIGTVLLAGGTLVIDAPDVLRDPGVFLRAMAHRAITSVDMPPSVLARLDVRGLPASLQTIVIGGEVAEVTAVRRAAERVRVVNVYGPTEATVCTSLERCGPDWGGASLGQPLPGVEYRDVDGELWIGGPCLARGYAGDKHRTAERFVWRDGRRWYCTGDRVRRDGEAWIFEGRVDRQVKLAGRRIEPEEVEHVLRTLGAEAAVVPRSEGGRTRLVAFVVEDGASGGASPCVGAQPRGSHPLAEALLQRLPVWLVPSVWVALPALPRTPHGKVDLDALSRMPLHAPRASWPSVPAERTLAELFAAALGLDVVAADGDFFDLGGDSLALLSLLTLAEARGIPLSASQVIAARSVRALAALIAFGQDPERRSTDELRQRAPAPPVPIPAAMRPSRKVAPDTLVLTGATGALGRGLHRRLLESGHRVVAIVRADSDAAACRRVQGEALAGDVATERMGLSERAYETLAARTVAVIHLAAQVSLAASCEGLEAVNVGGTRRALELAERAEAAIFHASTLSVFVASDRSERVFFEADDGSEPCSLYGGYAQTKWIAEQLVLGAPAACLIRYGLLTPDRTMPEVARNDWLARFVRELAARGTCSSALAERELAFDATPVDHAIEATAHLIARRSRGTFHVAGARPVTVSRLIAALRAEGVSVRVTDDDVPADASLVLGAARSHGAAVFGRHRALDLFAATGVRFDDARARAEGISAPEVTDAYLRACVRAMLAATGPS